MQSPASSPLRGILLKLASVAVFAVMSACIKAARDAVPAGEAVFFRSSLALIPVVVWAALQGPLRHAFTTANIRGHFWRGVIGATSMVCGFAALGMIPLPEVIAINFASPLLATILAIFLLGEVVRMFRWTAIVLGLVGVAIMIEPRLTLIRDGGFGNTQALGAGLALAGTLLMALAQIHVRWLTRTEGVLAIVFWFHVSCSVAALLTLPFGWVWPDGQTAALLLVAGLCGGVAQILLTESYRQADASAIAPFDYSAMLWGLAIGWAIFDEVPERQMLAGAALVIAAGLFILFRERRLGILQKRTAARRANTPKL